MPTVAFIFEAKQIQMKRYLVYHSTIRRSNGLDHEIANLMCFLREAFLLNRIPVITKPNLHKRNNLDYSTEHMDWDMFIDLDYEKKIIKLKRKEMEIIGLKEFGGLKFKKEQIAKVGPKQKVPEEVKDKPLVIRYVNTSLWKKSQYRNLHTIQLGDAEPSAYVQKIGNTVVENLPQDFVYLHIRREDRLYKNNKPHLKIFTSPFYVKIFLNSYIGKGRDIYLGTDEKDRNFFDNLNKDYQIITYRNYPQLKKLISAEDNNKPNNYLLYTIERYIGKKSSLKIETTKKLAIKNGIELELCPEYMRKIFPFLRNNRLGEIIIATLGYVHLLFLLLKYPFRQKPKV